MYLWDARLCVLTDCLAEVRAAAGDVKQASSLCHQLMLRPPVHSREVHCETPASHQMSSKPQPVQLSLCLWAAEEHSMGGSPH